jgi:hypothetical protein
MIRPLAAMVVAAAASCSTVPIAAQQEPQVQATMVTHPSKCAEEGGCIFVSRARLVQEIKAAAQALKPEICRRDSTV